MKRKIFKKTFQFKLWYSEQWIRKHKSNVFEYRDNSKVNRVLDKVLYELAKEV